MGCYQVVTGPVYLAAQMLPRVLLGALFWAWSSERQLVLKEKSECMAVGTFPQFLRASVSALREEVPRLFLSWVLTSPSSRVRFLLSVYFS